MKRTDTDAASLLPRLALPCPAPRPCVCSERKKNEHCDLDHRRTVHALQLDVRLLPRYGRDELPLRKPQRVSHVMLGMITHLHILVPVAGSTLN